MKTDGMSLICPCCQAVFPIEAGLNDLAARRAIDAAFKLTPFGDLLLGYVRLFSPAKRAQSHARMARLLEELLPMIREGRIERRGRSCAAPHDYWKQALAATLAARDTGTLTVPLKSHGYLLTIIAGYGDKAEARVEAQLEDRKAGRTPVGGQIPSPGLRPPSPACGRGAGGEGGPRAPMPPTVKAALRPREPEDASGPQEINDAG